MAYYGIDIHSDSATCAMIKNERRQHDIKIFSCPVFGAGFERFLKGLTEEDVILIEATTLSFWFYDQVKDKVRDCYILNSNKLTVQGNKTDKIDATRLVKTLTYNELMITDPAELPYIYVPSEGVRELRGMFTTYRLNQKMLTQSMNRIHSVFKQNGMKIDRKSLSSKKFRGNELLHYNLSSVWMVQVVSLVNTIDALETEKKQIKDLICFKGYKLFPKQVTNLISIKGFSPLTAVALMADVATIDRFSSSKRFCSYLRTAPRVTASNATVHLGRTNKQGRSLTCTLLTQSVNHLSSAGPHFTEFKARIKKGKKPCTVRMAVIRKILVSAYHMLKRDQLFHWVDEKSYEKKLTELHRVIRKYEKSEKKEIA